MEIQKLLACCENWSDGEKDYLKNWFKNIAKFEEEQLIDILKDSDSMCRLFFLQESCGISRQKYTRIARGVQALLEYYEIKSVVPGREKVLDSQNLIYLYKDIQSLISMIDYVGGLKLPDYDVEKDLLAIKSIAILGWYGFTLKEIANMRKNMLHEINSQYFIEAGKTEIDYDSYNILKNHAQSISYRRLPSGKTYSYQGNEELLFRNAIFDGEINEYNLMNLLVGFNNVSEELGFIIKFIQLRKNALFVAVSQDKLFDDKAEAIKKTFKCSPRTARSLYKEYLYWEKITA